MQKVTVVVIAMSPEHALYCDRLPHPWPGASRGEDNIPACPVSEFVGRYFPGRRWFGCPNLSAISYIYSKLKKKRFTKNVAGCRQIRTHFPAGLNLPRLGNTLRVAFAGFAGSFRSIEAYGSDFRLYSTQFRPAGFYSYVETHTNESGRALRGPGVCLHRRESQIHQRASYRRIETIFNMVISSAYLATKENH